MDSAGFCRREAEELVRSGGHVEVAIIGAHLDGGSQVVSMRR